MRRVVEEHETGADGIAKVQHVDARGRLIQPVAISSRVEPEQAADQEPDCCLVRYDEHALPWMARDEPANPRQRASQHRDTALAARRRERKRILLPRGILLGK